MVRLVFRPYTQLWRSICTSESLRSSIRVSPDFNLARHSSPSFGSQRVCSCCSARSEVDAKRRGCATYMDHPSDTNVPFAFTAPLGLVRPMARTHVRLLGPCFKTGRRGHRPTRDWDASRANECARYTSWLKYPPQPWEAGARGLPQQVATNFTQVHAPQAAVRHVKPRRSAVVSRRFTTRPVLTDQKRAENAQPPTWICGSRLREPLRLPLHSFTYSWTLSSKFFSTFPHGTCSLSVSGSYLALRGVYHALWAALPSNPTLGRSRHSETAALRAYHPLWAMAPVKVDFGWSSRREEAPPNTTFRAT